MNTFGREFDRFVKAGIAAKKWKNRAELGRMTGLSEPFMTDVVKGRRNLSMEKLEFALNSAGISDEDGERLKTALARQKASESASLAPLLEAVERETEVLREGGLALITIIEQQRGQVPEALRKLFQPLK